VRREMNDSRSFGVSGVELHAASISYGPDDREGGFGPGSTVTGRQRTSDLMACSVTVDTGDEPRPALERILQAGGRRLEPGTLHFRGPC
jgi:hypothetical protein